MADRPPAPAGLHLVPAAGIRSADDGRVIVGGSPPRLLRLSAAGAARVRAWFDGEAVGVGGAERRLARRLLDAGVAHPRSSMPDPSHGRVVVVIPARDEPGVAAIAPALADARPVIVVDDGSDEPIRATGAIEVVRRAESGGPGTARNDGGRRAIELGAEFVAFVDADVDAHRGWIDGLLGHFADSNVAAVAPRVRPAVGTSTLERYEQTFPSLDLGSSQASVGPGRAVAYAPSAALVVRAAAFEQLGGFDPELRFGEDVDLVWRFVAAGWTVRYEPTVEVRHRARADWRSWARQRRDYGSSAAALAARHGDAVAPARAPVGVYATVAAGVLAPFPVAAAVGAVEAVAADRRVAGSLDEHHDRQLVLGGLATATQTTVIALLRAWLPVTAIVAASGRRPRRRMVALLVGVVAAEVASTPRPLGWLRTVALRLVDHTAYGVGVWSGLNRVGRTGLSAIMPAVSRPGVRSDPPPGDTVSG